MSTRTDAAYDDLAMAELAIAEKPELMLPLTGELVDLRQPAQVAKALDSVRQAKNHLDQVRQLLESVLRLEASRQGTKTLHLDGIDAVITGGEKVEYDGEQLLRLLEKAGMPPERVMQIVEMVVSYKVNAARAKQAAGANPAYAEAVAQTRTVVPAAWRVSTRRT